MRLAYVIATYAGARHSDPSDPLDPAQYLKVRFRQCKKVQPQKREK